jgi:hypothetical protein
VEPNAALQLTPSSETAAINCDTNEDRRVFIMDDQFAEDGVDFN